MSPLSIYKASAGSGKTYKLTLGYLELLFNDPLSYRKILAVTFTNKAASEMKYRILERLYEISHYKPTDISEEFILLEKSTGKSREILIQLSQNLLVSILNDYSRFSVETIDRFFQSIIRAFARENGLPAGFILELDRSSILGEAVDRMFLDLGTDTELFDWMLRLADLRIESARGWNFRNEILSLGNELFSEGYQSIMLEKENLISRTQLNEFVSELNTMLEKAQNKIKQKAGEVSGEMGQAGYTAEHFLRKNNGPCGYFEKILDGRKPEMSNAQKKARNDIRKWISANETDKDKIHFVESKLMPACHYMYDQLVVYNSANEIRQYVYALGILGDLSGKIQEITDEKNLFLLSDASRFLKGLIGNNPTPFIYEKTGNKIDHIMLDEFQDTSVFQWENFKPLLEHTLSLGKENIIVGDIKQSIYRWRNSDWKILADVVKKSFPGFGIEEEALNYNWRSSELIIRFNNTLFSYAPILIHRLIDESLEEAHVNEDFKNRWKDLLNIAYDKVQQEIPAHSKGADAYIRAEILQDSGKKLKELALDKLPEWIRELQDAGYLAGDIAILVRTNKEGADVAAVLMEHAGRSENKDYNFSFVSNDSLFLINNPAVKFLVSLINYMNKPDDNLNNLTLLYYYHYLLSDQNEINNENLMSLENVQEVLIKKFSEKLPELKRLSLFELIENLIDIFSLDSNTTNLPYLQAFQETVLEIQQEEPGSIHDFLEYWNEAGIKKTITISEEQDAQRIITIHKAKGLQYKAVIIPFCDWNLASMAGGYSETILWCKTKGTPFDSIPVVPVKFKNAIKDTFFAESYLEELIMGFVDNLNLLYVALTRAEEALIIGLPGDNKEGTLKKSGHLVINAAAMSANTEDELCMDIASVIDKSGILLGKLPEISKQKSFQDPLWVIENYPVKFRNETMKIHLKSSDYFLDATDKSREQLNFGNIMHEIFGSIQTRDDVLRAVSKFHREGIIGRESSAYLTQLIEEKLDNPAVKEWYAGKYEVINEREIFSEGKIYRPDRVMVAEKKAIVLDYKFGESEITEYVVQVKKYCALLMKLGYLKVEGFIWYVMTDKIVKIN